MNKSKEVLILPAFRIWSKTQKKFVSNRLIGQDLLVYDWILHNSWRGEVEVEPAKDNWPGSDGQSMYIIQQFTGKIDSKGEPIYCGDIIRYTFKMCELGDAERHVGEVYYDNDSAAFLFDRSFEYSWLDSCIISQSILVIGNVLETPELLKIS
jgi:hypothetical protein